MNPNLFCVFMGHKWTPGEATNEPGVLMACQRCGRMRTFPEDDGHARIERGADHADHGGQF